MRKLAVREHTSPMSPWEVYQNLYPSSRVSFFLDSIEPRLPDQRFSYLGADPFLEVTIPAPGRSGSPDIRVSGEMRFKAPAPRFFKVLRFLFQKYGNVRAYPFFTGGAVGYFGYEMVRFFERIRFRKKRDSGFPWLYLGFYREVIVYDHFKKCYFLAIDRAELAKQKDPFARLRRFFRPRPKPGERNFQVRSFRAGVSRRGFEAIVRRAKRYIAAGDIYQANLSQRFSFSAAGSKLTLYDRLRTINPSPFSSFLKVRDLEIVSCSPERLIKKSGRLCVTRPIAGTRPSYRGMPRKNERMKRELLASQKERAEHIMLVDLERNDLGRVCDWRTVRVEEMMTTEKYSHVIHIVSKITGRIRKDCDAADLIRAMFPGGTITGCPKIRCMEIIDELEPVRRGIYTGSIGYLDFNGDLDLNIVIRTLVMKNQRGYLQVGAGIVHDSDPGREFEETLDKGRALVEAMRTAGVKRTGKKIR